jgi:hypothetical protein
MLTDRIPAGRNFYCTIRTARLDLESVARLFGDAGWHVKSTVNLVGLESDRGRLTLEIGSPLVLDGWITEPEHVLNLLARPGFLLNAEWRDKHQGLTQRTQWPWPCPACGTLTLVRSSVSGCETFHCSKCHRIFQRDGGVWDTVLSEQRLEP